MQRASRAYLALLLLFSGGLLLLLWHFGLPVRNPWAVPFVLAFFFVAYQFDVRIPGLGSMNVDHVIAFPAVVILQNPAVAGILGGIGLLASRAYRHGPRGLRLVHAWGVVMTAASLILGCWLYTDMAPLVVPGGWGWLGILLLAMAAANTFNWVVYLLGRALTGSSTNLEMVCKSFLQNQMWVLVSSPFVGLVLGAATELRPLRLFLSSLTLLLVIWSLRLNAGLEEKHAALVGAARRQEFLQQPTGGATGYLADEGFLKKLLGGLREFVPWERAVILVLPPAQPEGPAMHSLEEIPIGPDLRSGLMGYLEDPVLREPRRVDRQDLRPLLLPDASSQLLVPVLTGELALGLLAAERGAQADPFREDEAQFLSLSLHQVAQGTQDQLLKTQLMRTNRRLVRQTEFLTRILQISNLLRVHLDVQGILDNVAKGIRESLGFRSVLISLYHEDRRFFERIAQAGLDDLWEEIRSVTPPEADIMEYLSERYRLNACYFVSHTEGKLSPYDILPSGVRESTQPDDWHPEDLLLVPLRDQDNRLLGIISVDEPQDGKVPSSETLRALEILANQTVYALESAQIHAQIKRQAVMDSLTGLYNHGYFQETFAVRSKEYAAAAIPYSVLMLDLDDFKQINDTFGHLTGDAVLGSVAGLLSSSIRSEDVAARYGGEEFAIFLPHRTSEQARAVADRIRSRVESLPLPVEGQSAPVQVTLSVGVASFPDDGKDHHVILEKADAALYAAKRQGKNRVC